MGTSEAPKPLVHLQVATCVDEHAMARESALGHDRREAARATRLERLTCRTEIALEVALERFAVSELLPLLCQLSPRLLRLGRRFAHTLFQPHNASPAGVYYLVAAATHAMLRLSRCFVCVCPEGPPQAVQFSLALALGARCAAGFEAGRMEAVPARGRDARAFKGLKTVSAGPHWHRHRRTHLPVALS
jgi:hypothetical protein